MRRKRRPVTAVGKEIAQFLSQCRKDAKEDRLMNKGAQIMPMGFYRYLVKPPGVSRGETVVFDAFHPPFKQALKVWTWWNGKPVRLK